MANMVHDKYVQQRGTCTHIASKCHKYFTDSIKNNRSQVLLHPSSILKTVFLIKYKYVF